MNELQIWICQENIQRFQAQLYKVRDEERRRVITKLLEEERDMLRTFTKVQENSTKVQENRHMPQPNQDTATDKGEISNSLYRVAESYGNSTSFFDI